MNGCALVYDITVTVCNHSEDDVCFSILNPLFNNGGGIDFVSTTFTTLNLSPNNCDNFTINIVANELNPTAVTFQLIDEDCAECDKIFGIDLTPAFEDLDINCLEKIENAEIFINHRLTDVSTMYYDFVLDLSGIFTNPMVVAVWSEPSAVIDFTYSYPYVNGLGAIDLGTVDPYDWVCIYVLVCDEDNMCVCQYCFKPGELEFRNSSSNDDDAAKAIGNETGYTEPALKPNPTTGEVSVVNTEDEVVEVVVMDMVGRHIAAFNRTAAFNIGTLSSGMYIVRVKTIHDDKSAEKVSYLKLVKK